ncbi:GGDEF domain-containing protein [Pseudomonas coronafaciens pv. oryzae]|uniref:diguanylate cyclase n=1 Tax=Pseudomonas coronafaciens TaxID=53409 RepID=UPI0006B54878|nr:diguanylate cyclase [Pseudomonas coronafaciens]KPB49810.1 GGDEF domain-containing protein [Pseudomonas coronafaciens pv. oryzae]KPY02267.1 GGDEF domain-containing protein [Pseudomonas coronafaciens pv. oryzae]RMT06603.1 GGDEF domain-containing protein [Pseudomonas coronafaciens pv. oryzae]
MEPVPSLLIVDDDISAIRVLSKVLQGLGQIRFATSGVQALKMVREMRPDLILLDAEMPGMNGFEVCEALKADQLLKDVPVIFVTSHTETRIEEAGLALGAVDFIGKPIQPLIVTARVKTHLRLKMAMDQLNLLAQTDGLTGLANRRFLDQSIEREWLRVRRNQGAFSLLLLDIDFFKRYNDRYGHLQGDECLISIAHALRCCVHRSTDLVARYGGEEFAVLLPDTGAEGACRMAEDIVQHIHSLKMPHETGDFGRVTVSVGVASLEAGTLPVTRPGTAITPVPDSIAVVLLAEADRALYRAKHEGRNCSRFVPIEVEQ